jgi:hypothetical protein
LKANVRYNQEAIPQLENLLSKLRRGERPKATYISGRLYVLPEILTIEKELKRRKEKLPRLVDELRKKQLRGVI